MFGVPIIVFILGLVSLLTDVSSEMIFPILPLYLTEVLGVSPTFLGLIEGVAESAASILKFLSGWISDKIRKRKLLVVVGYSLSALTKPLFAFTSSWWQVLSVRLTDRIGKGIRTAPRDAIIAEATGRKKRGSAYGLHRAMDTTGAVLGPLLAFFLLPLFASKEQAYRTIFLVSFIPGLLAVILLMLFVKEGELKIKVKERKPLSRKTKRFIAISFLFALANFSYAFFILKAKQVGISEHFIPLFYLLFNVVYAVSSFPVGKISDKVGTKNSVAFSYLLFALTCISLIFISSSLIFLSFILYGLFNAVYETTQRAYISKLEEERKGFSFGLFYAIIGFAILPSSVIAGFLWENISPAAVFLFSAVVSVLASLLLFVSDP